MEKVLPMAQANALSPFRNKAWAWREWAADLAAEPTGETGKVDFALWENGLLWEGKKGRFHRSEMRESKWLGAEEVDWIDRSFAQLFIREFFSQSREGQRLTTTSLPFSEEKAGKKLFKQVLPQADLAGLLQAHRDRLQEWSGGWLECPPDLQVLARSVDEYMVLWS